MEQERKVLGILAIVFGGIALVGSWMPIINNLSTAYEDTIIYTVSQYVEI